MPTWIKNLVMLVFLSVWATVMLVQLKRGDSPEPLLWGMPGGFWVVLNPSFRRPGDPGTGAGGEAEPAPPGVAR